MAYSRAGASGIYFAGLIERLGIAAAVNAKAVIIPMGFTAEKVASGEADLAVQQISELMTVPGIDVAGPFPAEIQVESRFEAAIFKDTTNAAGAAAFLRCLTSAQAAQAYAAVAEIRFDASGEATFLLGTHSHGQGHETVFRQLAAHVFDLSPERVRIVYGDTDQVYFGKGTFGSRSVGVGGAAVLRAAEAIIAKGKLIAAHLLEAAADDLVFRDGRFAVAGTDRSIGLDDVAGAAFSPERLPPGLALGLSASAIITPPNATFPNGCHVCEVEIDPETGALVLTRYAVVDDVGRVVNPLLLDGQIHGGVAQGVGQALGERIVYDRDSGQLLSGTFMDYAMPRADELPFFAVEANEVPTPNNPLGIKGAGEAGTVGALPALMNAVNDALAPLGVRHFDMPATPERLWRAISEARARGQAGTDQTTDRGSER